MSNKRELHIGNIGGDFRVKGDVVAGEEPGQSGGQQIRERRAKVLSRRAARICVDMGDRARSHHQVVLRLERGVRVVSEHGRGGRNVECRENLG